MNQYMNIIKELSMSIVQKLAGITKGQFSIFNLEVKFQKETQMN